MGREEIIYLIPYAGSLGITIGILIYTWLRRNATGANIFFWFIFGQTLYIFGNILETIAFDFRIKLFWESFQWVVASIPVIAFPFFAIQYTEYKIRYIKRLFVAACIVPLGFSILVITDPLHNLIYHNPQVIQTRLFSALVYDYSPLFIAYTIYVYFIALLSGTLLVLRMMQPHQLYRIQIGFILVGFLFPLLGSILSLTEISITPQRDSSPITIAIGNMLLAWGFYRFRIFDILPIARDKVFEAMVDLVVVVDNRNNIVDVNSSMLTLIGKTANEVIGKPASLIFESLAIPINSNVNLLASARTETVFEIGGFNIFYETTELPLYNSRKELTGKIYISHDITALKQLEYELRKLNVQLEKRVMERTHELAEAYDITLEGWARALELRDKETEGHSRRVTDMTLKMALKLGFPDETIEHIRRGAILHDIGKMGIPDEILHKNDKLTEQERQTVMKHPETAYKLIKPISFLEQAMEIPYCHHEKWDGTGYPRGIQGEEIPISARIFAVADVWDALSNDRPYNNAWSREKIIQYFHEQSGKHFDPYIVKIFLAMVDKGEI